MPMAILPPPPPPQTIEVNNAIMADMDVLEVADSFGLISYLRMFCFFEGLVRTIALAMRAEAGGCYWGLGLG